MSRLHKEFKPQSFDCNCMVWIPIKDQLRWNYFNSFAETFVIFVIFVVLYLAPRPSTIVKPGFDIWMLLSQDDVSSELEDRANSRNL